jgi:hypothetical protein
MEMGMAGFGHNHNGMGSAWPALTCEYNGAGIVLLLEK